MTDAEAATIGELARRWGANENAVRQALGRGSRKKRPAPARLPGAGPARYDVAVADRWWGWDEVPHGTAAGYRYHRCRCPDCREYHRAEMAALRHAKLYGDGGPMSPAVRGRILDAVVGGASVLAAAAAVGVSHQRVYAAARALPDFGVDLNAATRR